MLSSHNSTAKPQAEALQRRRRAASHITYQNQPDQQIRHVERVVVPSKVFPKELPNACVCMCLWVYVLFYSQSRWPILAEDRPPGLSCHKWPRISRPFVVFLCKFCDRTL